VEVRTPEEILVHAIDVGVYRTQRKLFAVLILSFLGGAFIAFASQGSSMAAFNLLANPDTFGLGRTLKGAVFGIGLMLVIFAGGDVFIGHNVLIVSVLDRKVSASRMFMHWAVIYAGNLLGSILIAWMMFHTGLFNSSNGLLGGMTITIAAYKTSLPFHSAFLLGILCNWLVCLAIWISWATIDITGRTLVVFFIIFLFVMSGFENSIANMYYIPAGILAKDNPQWLIMSGLSLDQLINLNWLTFFSKNLIPVTLGNTVGGTVFVGFLYWLSLGKRKRT